MNEIQSINIFLNRTGLRVYHLADLAHVPRKSLYRFMRGEADIKLAQWRRIEKIISRKPE